MTTTAVVTGAGRGLGRLIAERLADRGHLVLLTDIDETAAHAAARAIGKGAWAMAHDVRDAARQVWRKIRTTSTTSPIASKSVF